MNDLNLLKKKLNNLHLARRNRRASVCVCVYVILWTDPPSRKKNTRDLLQARRGEEEWKKKFFFLGYWTFIVKRTRAYSCVHHTHTASAAVEPSCRQKKFFFFFIITGLMSLSRLNVNTNHVNVDDEKKTYVTEDKMCRKSKRKSFLFFFFYFLFWEI